jgi:hypothetical protein
MALISILTTSIHIHKLNGLLNCIEHTVSDPNNIEFLLKIDDNNSDIINYVNQESKRRPFRIAYIVSPRLNGYWSIHQFIDNLLRLVSQETYFIWIPNDEIRLKTNSWDVIIQKYYKKHDDDIINIRIFNNKKKPNCLIDCAPVAEHFGFITKRWWDITEGVRFDGTDTGPAFINYHLNSFFSKNRTVEIDDIEFDNIGTAISPFDGLNEKEIIDKNVKIMKNYTKYFSYEHQCRLHFLAAKLNCHITQFEKYGDNFDIYIDYFNKNIYSQSKKNGDVDRFSYSFPYMKWFREIMKSVSVNIEYFIWPPVIACLINEKNKLEKSMIFDKDRYPIDAVGNNKQFFIKAIGAYIEKSIALLDKDSRKLLNKVLM